MKAEYLMMAAVFALLCAQPASATVARQYCLNDTVEAVLANFTITESVTTADFTYYQEHLCDNGCSTSLSMCRWSAFYSIVFTLALLLALIFIGILGFYVAGNYAPVILMLLFTFMLMILGTDVFTGYNKLLLLIVSIALFAMNIDNLLKHRNSDKAAKEDDE